jgi:hypothetical protein
MSGTCLEINYKLFFLEINCHLNVEDNLQQFLMKTVFKSGRW